MRRYQGVIRLKEENYFIMKEGEPVEVQEKIDGANASFKVKDGELKCYSRNNPLSKENTLRGFYDFIQERAEVLSTLREGLIVYGEWLVSHTVIYKPECYQQFYVFDVFDESVGKYLQPDEVREVAKSLSLKSVPVLFSGISGGYDHIASFIGKSDMATTEGEGIIVKNLRHSTEEQLYVKLVGESFVERKATKKPPSALPSEKLELIDTVVNKARVEKTLHKLVDEGILEEGWDGSSLGIVAKHLPKRIVQDVIKEEPDVVEEVGKTFGRLAGRSVMIMAKEICRGNHTFK